MSLIVNFTTSELYYDDHVEESIYEYMRQQQH